MEMVKSSPNPNSPFALRHSDTPEEIKTKKLAIILSRCVQKRLSTEKQVFMPKLKNGKL